MDIPFDQSETVCFIIFISEGRMSKGISFNSFVLWVRIDRAAKKRNIKNDFSLWGMSHKEKKKGKLSISQISRVMESAVGALTPSRNLDRCSERQSNKNRHEPMLKRHRVS